jgi:integrase/recombinase XerD
MNVKEGGGVRLSQIEAVAAIWSQPKGRKCSRSASPKARTRFFNDAVPWLRFLGWLDEPERECHPHHAQIRVFEEWMRRELSLFEETIQDYLRAAAHFLFWLAGAALN